MMPVDCGKRTPLYVDSVKRVLHGVGEARGVDEAAQRSLADRGSTACSTTGADNLEHLLDPRAKDAQQRASAGELRKAAGQSRPISV